MPKMQYEHGIKDTMHPRCSGEERGSAGAIEFWALAGLPQGRSAWDHW